MEIFHLIELVRAEAQTAMQMTTIYLAVDRFLRSVRPSHVFEYKATEDYLRIEMQQPSSFTVLHNGRSLEASLAKAEAERERKVLEFDQKRPRGNRIYQSRVSSWADPISARDNLDGEEEELGVGIKRRNLMKPSRLAEGNAAVEDENEGEFVEDWSDVGSGAPRRTYVYDAQR